MRNPSPRSAFTLIGALVVCLLAVPARAAELCTAVRAPNGKVSFIFGTIHMEDPRLWPLPAGPRHALGAAKQVVLESILSPETVGAAARQVYLPQGTTLRKTVGDALYQDTLAVAARHNLPPESVERMKPWAVAAALGTPPPQGGPVLDLLIQEYARGAGKEVKGLETVQEQLAAFDTLDASVQKALLKEAVARYAEFPELHGQLLNAYLGGKLDPIAHLADLYLAGGAPQLAATLRTRLIEQRNVRMAQRAGPLLAAGDTFMAVGALHLPGPKGVLALLERAGFKLSPGC